MPSDVSAWIHIAADNHISVFTGKVEVGQNIRTSLAQQVADELMVPFDAITMVMGDTDLIPCDAGTFGSQSTPQMGPRLRTMAAAARQALVEIAAKQWSCDAAALVVANGKVTAPNSNQSLTYGQLTKGEKLVTTVSANVPLLAPKDWKIAGTPVPKANGRDFVTGKHQYPSDISLPGMMFGKVLRASGYNATLDSVDTSAAEKMPGVKLVRDGDFIGVVAPDAWTAEAGPRLASRPSGPCRRSPRTRTSSTTSRPTPNPRPRRRRRAKRNRAGRRRYSAAPTGAIELAQSYTVQYIAHAPLEPRAAVAQWDSAGKLTVWTGTQRPFGVKDELVAAFHLDPAKVRVIHPDMGSRLRRQAHRRSRRRSRASRQRRRRARQARLDPRRGVHLGLLPSRRPDGAQSLRPARRHARLLGASQLQLRQRGPRHAV